MGQRSRPLRVSRFAAIFASACEGELRAGAIWEVECMFSLNTELTVIYYSQRKIFIERTRFVQSIAFDCPPIISIGIDDHNTSRSSVLKATYLHHGSRYCDALKHIDGCCEPPPMHLLIHASNPRARSLISRPTTCRHLKDHVQL